MVTTVKNNNCGNREMCFTFDAKRGVPFCRLGHFPVDFPILINGNHRKNSIFAEAPLPGLLHLNGALLESIGGRPGLHAILLNHAFADVAASIQRSAQRTMVENL